MPNLVRVSCTSRASGIRHGVERAASGTTPCRRAVLASDLVDLAHRQLDLALRPLVIRLRRLVIAEATDFPELGRVFHERGPQRTVQALTLMFARLAEDGRLQTPNAGTSASQFNWLVMAEPVNRLMLLGEEGRLPSPDLNRHVLDAVHTFLTAHALNTDHA